MSRQRRTYPPWKSSEWNKIEEVYKTQWKSMAVNLDRKLELWGITAKWEGENGEGYLQNAMVHFLEKGQVVEEVKNAKGLILRVANWQILADLRKYGYIKPKSKPPPEVTDKSNTELEKSPDPPPDPPPKPSIQSPEPPPKSSSESPPKEVLVDYTEAPLDYWGEPESISNLEIETSIDRESELETSPKKYTPEPTSFDNLNDSPETSTPSESDYVITLVDISQAAKLLSSTQRKLMECLLVELSPETIQYILKQSPNLYYVTLFNARKRLKGLLSGYF